jgi:hypothetical protein
MHWLWCTVPRGEVSVGVGPPCRSKSRMWHALSLGIIGSNITVPSPSNPAVSSAVIECECNRMSAKAIRHSRQETSVGRERLHFIAIANKTT